MEAQKQRFKFAARKYNVYFKRYNIKRKIQICPI